MPTNSQLKGLLYNAIEQIGRPTSSDYGRDTVGLLCADARREIFRKIRLEAGGDDHFQLFLARLGTLCAQATRPFLDPQDERALSLLDTLSAHVDAGDLSGLHAEVARAQQLFEDADRTDQDARYPTLKDEPDQQSKLAQSTIAQAVKLATGGFKMDNMPAYISNVGPKDWMPEVWAAISFANGLSQFQHSMSHKMRHFWTWYLNEGIPQALDLDHPTTAPGCPPASEEPPGELMRFASPWSTRLVADAVRTSRRAFLNGYVEKEVNTRGRTTSMKFMHDGEPCGRLWVDYQGRKGGYTDDRYGGINYQSGCSEEVHLSHLASSTDNVPIDQWVADMEAQLLKDILSTRFGWFFEWASMYWEEPFQPELHHDDLRVCMASIEWTFEVSKVTVEGARPYHQIMWCFCAFALDEQVDRARALFHKAWEEDGNLLAAAKDRIMDMAHRHN